MDLTVADVSGLALAGKEKTGKPDLCWAFRPVLMARPFRARAEMTAPADDFCASAISLAAARTASSMSSVVLMACIKASDAEMSIRLRQSNLDSCRTYLNKPIDDQRRRRLAEFLDADQTGPLGSRVRFALVAATDDDDEALRGLETYGFIKGATGFIVGAAERTPKDMEDYDYLMEHAILFATDLGLGTCWLGGTFSKSRFARFQIVGVGADHCRDLNAGSIGVSNK